MPTPTTPASPPWLTDEQQGIWRAWLLGVARVQRHLDTVLREFGLDIAEYEILVVLSESPDRQCRMAQLADQVHQSRSRLTHTVSRMERSGWVERDRSPSDGRGVLARLTPSGLRFLQGVAPVHVQSVRDAFVDVVAPEDFCAIGRAMAAVLAATGGDRPVTTLPA